MAWLSAYDDGNKIIDEKALRPESIKVPQQTVYPIGHDDPDEPGKKLTAVKVVVTYVTQVRSVTEMRYRYVSMTYSAACQCAEDNHGTKVVDGVAHHLTAVVRRQNEGDAYYVEIIDQAYGDYLKE